MVDSGVIVWKESHDDINNVNNAVFIVVITTVRQIADRSRIENRWMLCVML